MQVAIIDYDLGNLASVAQGMKAVGLDPIITRDKDIILNAQGVVLPGVGAFPKGMENLKQYDLISVINEVVKKGTPFMGICLGMQLLFDQSDEHGYTEGLGLIKGNVKRFPEGLKVPHMGWNTLKIENKHQILDTVEEGSYVYFVHSYYVSDCEFPNLVATTDYGVEVPAVVFSNNVIGVQFHPEKSSGIGLKILSNFRELVANADYSSN